MVGMILFAVLCGLGVATATAADMVVLQTVEQGVIRGTQRTTAAGTRVAEFKGIPFAAPPLGAGRFAPPRPPTNWSGVLDATDYKHNCMQGSMNMGWPQPFSTQSEDCLYLNVFAPAVKPVKPVPVIFWIFGGGFQGGGGNETRLNGTWDVALQNGEVIIVTHSYRVNIFGFLASDLLRPRDTGPGGGSTGNYGIQDQRAAMQWTARNIAVFGGDPKQVFIVGQSAGGNSVSQHLVRPKSWGLFSSAGMESGAFYDGVQTATPESQKPTWDKLVSRLHCSDAKDVVDCVVTAPTAALVAANDDCCGGWSITVDGVDLVAPGPMLAVQGKLAKVPIIAGSVREDIASPYAAVVNASHPPIPCKPQTCSESDFRAYGVSLGFSSAEVDSFVLAYQGPPENGAPSQPPGATAWHWAIKHAGSDAWATCPARRMARWYGAIGQPAYWYYWTHIPDGPNGNGGAHHACEQPFVFHVLAETPAELKEDGGHYHINASNPLEVTLSTQTVGFWAAMAASGAPGPSWPAYDATGTAMIFGDTAPLPAKAISNVRTAKCDFWDVQFDKVLAAYPVDGRAFHLRTFTPRAVF